MLVWLLRSAALGADVEADEVYFQAKAVRCEDGRMGVLWLRYVCFAQHGTRQLLHRDLGSRIVANTGQGGGGHLTDEELYHTMFCGEVPAFRLGSVAQTDIAQAYVSLGQKAPSLEAPPEDVQKAMTLGQPDSDAHVKRRPETQTKG